MKRAPWRYLLPRFREFFSSRSYGAIGECGHSPPLLPTYDVGVLAFAARLAICAIREEVVTARVGFAWCLIHVWVAPRVERDSFSEVWAAPVRARFVGGLCVERFEADRGRWILAVVGR